MNTKISEILSNVKEDYSLKGKNAVVGLSAVVIKNVNDDATVVGNSNKRIK